MKLLLPFAFLIFFFDTAISAQAVFQSNGSGNWSSPSSWILISGTTTANYPVAGDSAAIISGQSITVDINSQCTSLTVTGGASLLLNASTSILSISNSLSINGASYLTMDMGALTISGSMTIGAGSTMTINQGALTVIGIASINAPVSPAGTTLLNVQGGLFSCAGGMTITATTVPAGRFAELRIGNSAVNIVGGLLTVSANAKINFTGIGALTLAGVISIANTASFIAGQGKVIYVGIPGTDQVIAPLTYYRLVTTGLGSGLKKINGAVVVTDTLTLLSDTLTTTGSGTLTLADGACIVRTTGTLLSAPVFAGVADIIYNNALPDTTGAEMPSGAGVLRNLTINDVSGITLGSAVTINNNLNLQLGALRTDVYSLAITNPAGGTTNDPAVQRSNGYIIGPMTRSIGTSTGIRLFPFGTGSNQNYREYKLEYTVAPANAGTLTVQHTDSSASNQSGLPLDDGGTILVRTAPLYWQADAAGGLSGGTYSLTLIATGIQGVSDINTLRVIKRPSAGGAWTANGTAGTNSGTNGAPVVNRQGMSGFSQFTLGADYSNTLPVRFLYFSGAVSGNAVTLSWATATESNSQYFSAEYSPDGLHFSSCGQVTAAGNSTVPHYYRLTPGVLPPGIYYYRLKQADIDNNYFYSNTILVTIKNAASLKLYPLPVNQTLTIEGGNGSAIRLLNAAGQYIRTLMPGTNDMTGLCRGMYYIMTPEAISRFIKL